MTNAKETVRVAAIADIHFAKMPEPSLQPLLTQLSDAADVALLCGDLTDYGLPEEAQLLAKQLSSGLRIPSIAVLGNHDYESGKQDEVRSILADAGVKVLDGEACEVHGIGFAGVKGFGGGFGTHVLAPWGEEAIKRFVQEAVDQTLELESSLARLRTPQKIALLHYSPIQATVEGEPREIFPFLGSSRLEEPLNRYSVAAVFHGHAHRGQLEGRTSTGVPVYNVSLSLLMRSAIDPPFRVIEVSPNIAVPAPVSASRSLEK
jgi:Icc-related predicted phosphoesterase